MSFPQPLRSALFLPAVAAAAGTQLSSCGAQQWWLVAGSACFIACGIAQVRRWALCGLWCAFGAWWMGCMEVHLHPGDGKAYRWDCLVVAPPRPYGTRFDHGCICHARSPSGPEAPQRVRIAWEEAVSVGHTVSTFARWQPWDVALDFDAVQVYRSAGWGARLTPLSDASPGVGDAARTWATHMHAYRLAIDSMWSARLSPRVAGLMQGLSTGSTSGIGSETQAAFAETGLVHVLSVSGYHVGLLGFLPLLLLRGRHRPLRAVGFILLLPLWMYMGVCGWTVPAVRACAMSTWYAVGQLCNRPVSAVHTWSIAVLATVVWRPSAFGQLGTQLSFVAVLGIVVAAVAVRNRGKLVQFAAVSSAATGATAPLTAPVFGVFPWAFLPVNAVAGPWVSLLGVLALVAACTPAAWNVAEGVELLGGAFLAAVEWAAGRWQLAWSVGDVPRLFWWWGAVTACAWIGAQWAEGAGLRRGKWVLLACLPISGIQVSTPSPPRWVLVRSGTPAVLFRSRGLTWCALSDSTEVKRTERTWNGLPAAWRDAQTPCIPCRQAEHGIHGVLGVSGGNGVALGVPWAFVRGRDGAGEFRWGSVREPWERWGESRAGAGP